MSKIVVLFLFFSLFFAATACAEDDIATLRRQLAEQQALNLEQQKKLEQQAQVLEALSKKLNQLAISKGNNPTPIADNQKRAESVEASLQATQTAFVSRDGVGDLKKEALQAGDFPGSIKLPGNAGVSLAIGGSLKTVAVADSNAEAMGADFLPAYLGTKRQDTDGAFNIDSTLTKLFLDGRAPAKDGQLRGYVEADFNGNNDSDLNLRMRHAYGSWKNQYGTLTAGHTWSTMMDLKILPEGLTEPTVSGAIFTRQPMIRWSQSIEEFTLHIALEEPSSSDLFDEQVIPELGNTRIPDGILALEYDKKEFGHFRLNGILRDIEVDTPTGDDNAVGWGISLSGHLDLFERDRWVFSGVYGQGLGRYLLGIQSTSGGILNPADNSLVLRDNWGILSAYQHHWTEKIRSAAMVGYAKAEPEDWQDENVFESSTYGALNLFWQILPYLNLGLEYSYGMQENKDGSDLDNHRIAIGFQFY